MLVVLLGQAVGGCPPPARTVRQQDLDAWVGVPVEALDLHPFFLTVPMFRTITAGGVEVRNDANGHDVASCATNASSTQFGTFVNAKTFTSCSSGRVVCNNLFYIRSGIVVEYAPTGQCYTDESVQPQPRYRKRQTVSPG